MIDPTSVWERVDATDAIVDDAERQAAHEQIAGPLAELVRERGTADVLYLAAYWRYVQPRRRTSAALAVELERIARLSHFEDLLDPAPRLDPT